MPTRCVVINCNNSTYTNGISLHSFPDADILKKKWIKFVQLKRKWTVPKNIKRSCICSAHFTPDQFLNSTKFRLGFSSNLQLKPTAVPTITFPNSNNVDAGSIVCRKKESQRVRKWTYFRMNCIIVWAPLYNSMYMKGPYNMCVNDTDIYLKAVFNINMLFKRSCIKYYIFQIVQQYDTETESNIAQKEHLEQKTSVASQCCLRPLSYSVGCSAKPNLVTTSTQTDLCLLEKEPVAHQSSESEFNASDDDQYCPGLEDLPDESDEEPCQPHEEPKYIVFQSKLHCLFKNCSKCGSRCSLKEQKRGSFLKIQQDCSNCNLQNIWSSQPEVEVKDNRRVPLGNIMLSAAILFSGLPISAALRMLTFVGIAVINTRTFFRHNARYLQPAVYHVWCAQQQSLLDVARTAPDGVVLGGDGRCDSPGHSSKFLSYTMMDLSNNKILDFQLVQSNEVGGSTKMELEGLDRSLDLLVSRYGIKVHSIITDRHVQVIKFLREQYSTTRHYFDVWHVAKGLAKKLELVSKRKDCEAIAPWIKSIANHLYWCAASSGGNGQLVVAKWKSLINHICNVHTHHDPLFPKCLHGDLDDNRAWLEIGTAACESLRDVLYKTRFLNDIQKLSPNQQTSSLEGFHSLIIRFAPKHTAYNYKGMLTRTALAAMHFNENSQRQQACTKLGRKQYKLVFPKYKKGEPSVSVVKRPCTYSKLY